jgi:hypothetical protein
LSNLFTNFVKVNHLILFIMKSLVILLLAAFALSIAPMNANAETFDKRPKSHKRGYNYKKAAIKKDRHAFFNKYTIRKNNGGCDWAR